MALLGTVPLTQEGCNKRVLWLILPLALAGINMLLEFFDVLFFLVGKLRQDFS